MKNEKLSAPIEPHEIEWRVQNVTKDKSKTVIVPYITNRCVMDRFDDAFGWDKWNSSFREIGNSFICTISVMTDNGLISKEDGADKTNIEATKGGISDSMKRCAVQYGLGRCLYNYPKIMLKGEVRFIDDSTLDRLSGMVKLINDNKFNKKVVVI